MYIYVYIHIYIYIYLFIQGPHRRSAAAGVVARSDYLYIRKKYVYYLIVYNEYNR